MGHPQDEILYGSDGTDFAGLIVYQMINGVMSILGFTYEKKGRKSLKVPGGCMAERENDILVTAVNELEQETNLVAQPSDLVHVWTNTKVPGKHHQHFFAVELRKLTGELRRDPMFDDDETLGKPVWLDLQTALNQLYFTHRQALEHMLRKLGSSTSPHYTPEFRHAVSRVQVAARLLMER